MGWSLGVIVPHSQVASSFLLLLLTTLPPDLVVGVHELSDLDVAGTNNHDIHLKDGDPFQIGLEPNMSHLSAECA